MIAFIEQFAEDAHTMDHWPGLLVGDLSQPRGRPMLSGHSSHQVGLDVDFWLTPMPDHTLTPEERETMTAVSMLRDPFTVDPHKWTPQHTQLIKRAASYPDVARIFVHPAIKKILCEQSIFMCDLPARLEQPTARVRSQWGNDDGCGQELTSWYAKLKKAAIAAANVPLPPVTPWRRKGRLSMAELPAQCSTVLTAGGSEPIPVGAETTMPVGALKALASKEAGPPLPRLVAAALRALIGVREAGMPLPDRNPTR